MAVPDFAAGEESTDRNDYAAIHGQDAGCALGYLDFRFADQADWRKDHPKQTARHRSHTRRHAMRASMPSG